MSGSESKDSRSIALLVGSGLPAAWALLEQVATGHAPFDADRRAWALAEGVDLSGWTLTEVQLAEGGDAALARRVLDLARQRDAEGAARRLAPWSAVTAPKQDEKTEPAASARESLERPLLQRVAAGHLALNAVQREMVIVDAMVRSGGALISAELLLLSDAALATHLLALPEVDPLTGAVVPLPDEAIAA